MSESVRLAGVTHVYVSETKAYLALDRIDLSLQTGEFISLVGPSGCGKTTLMSIVAGLIQPTCGEVEVFGASPGAKNGKIGYMLQQDYLFPWRTILDNALIGLELTGNKTPEKERFVRELLEEMGLGDVLAQYPRQLSGGMRQRVALVRTLSTNPELLLLDEPFSALDYQTKLQLEDLVAETLKARGKTAILVTHDISEAIAMSDRVLVMQRNPGRIKREWLVPEAIRQSAPFHAREQTDFHRLFHGIWRDLENEEERDQVSPSQKEEPI
ncbi:ABC transporter ATP-binding protein [Paenibacillus sp. y28]|uniref:ABC transporter ATP-binding protein n=1 Tax=Paenibacillus sp. y28 TaxID=3129110 RepID=UPI003015A400